MRQPERCAITQAMRTDRQPIRLTLFAPDGRMGRAIAEAAAADPGFAIDPDHGDVLVDFSADWCATCKLNLKVAINTKDVASAVDANEIVPMLADWTPPFSAYAS